MFLKKNCYLESISIYLQRRYIYLLIFFILLLRSDLYSSGLQEHISEFIINYSRPVTILYISNRPKPISLRNRDVLVIWSQKKNLQSLLQKENRSQTILLEGPFSKDNMISLAECEHFDIAIIQRDDDDLAQILSDAHFADYTFLITKQPFDSTYQVGKIGTKKVYFIHCPKTILKNNCWKSASTHKNYSIESTFDNKFFIKPGEYRDEKVPKQCFWKPGINLLTYANLNGTYPSKKFIREKLIEIFSPLTHHDFVAGNVIIQGIVLKAIDYDDTKYSQDPYERLRIALETQLGIEYH